jgi:hypothetical protein
MTRLLKNLVIDEVSCVVKGADPGAKVMIHKSDDCHFGAPLLFNDIMAKADVSDPLRGPRDEDDGDKVSSKLNAMVDAMMIAAPTLDRQAAAHYLMNTSHGRKLYEHLSKGETIMPQVDIRKLIPVMEDCLMATVTQRDGESYAKSFSRKYENDISFRKQWRDLTEAKMLLLSKGTATLTPTSAVVGNTNTKDDSAEAVRLLSEMAEKQGRSFETVFSDPANAKLAARTYTAAHRSSINIDYLEG